MSKKPTPKVAAGGAASSATAILTGLANDFHVDLTWLTSKPTLYGLVIAAIGFAAGWIKRETS